MIVKCFRKIKTFKPTPDVDPIPTTLPAGQSPEAAAVDLQGWEDFALEAGERRVVDTGLIVRAPRNSCFLVLSRSGLAAKKGICVLNAPGLIDRDYCGPEDTLKVILHNAGKEAVEFKAGDRIAQLMLNPLAPIEWNEQDDANFAGINNRGGLGATGGIKSLAEHRSALLDQIK